MNKNITSGRPVDLKSLLALTNKYYYPDKHEMRGDTVPKKAEIKSSLKRHVDAGDIRTVTKVLPVSCTDNASFKKKRMRFWVKISAIFSSKKKAS